MKIINYMVNIITTGKNGFNNFFSLKLNDYNQCIILYNLDLLAKAKFFDLIDEDTFFHIISLDNESILSDQGVFVFD